MNPRESAAMGVDEQTTDLLWEFVYGLLSDEDASALRDRIASDPAVARAYATIRLKADLIAAAARLDPSTEAGESQLLPSGDRLPAARRVNDRGQAPKKLARSVRVVATIAASLLLVWGGYAYTRGPHALPMLADARLAESSLAVDVALTMPQEFSPAIDNPILVSVSQAVAPAEVELRVYDQENELTLRRTARTDERGVSRLTLPGTSLPDGGHLEVGLPGQTAALETRLAVANETALTRHSSGTLVDEQGLAAASDMAAPFIVEPARNRENLSRLEKLEVAEQLDDRLGHVPAAEPAAERLYYQSAHPRLEYYPEGGQLVGGLRNRVYYATSDTVDDASPEQSLRVFDAQETLVASTETRHAGRGRFSLVPVRDQEYEGRLEGLGLSAELPAAVAEGVSLETAASVFSADEGIELTVRTVDVASGMIVAASQQRSVVGLEHLAAKDFRADAEGGWVAHCQVKLTSGVGGLLRLGVFDGESLTRNPAQKPSAERWVFVRPAESLELQVERLPATFQPGEEVRVLVRAMGQQGRPEPAVLYATWALVPSQPATEVIPRAELNPLPSHDYLLQELGATGRLSRSACNWAKAANPDLALDLLLATQPPPSWSSNSLAVSGAQSGPRAAAIQQLRSAFEVPPSVATGNARSRLAEPPTWTRLWPLAIVLAVGLGSLLVWDSTRCPSDYRWASVAAGGVSIATVLILLTIDSLSGRRDGSLNQSKQVAAVSAGPVTELGPPVAEGELKQAGVGAADASAKAMADGAAKQEATRRLRERLQVPPPTLVMMDPDGTATLTFRVPNEPSEIRLRIDAQAANRMGCVETRIVVAESPGAATPQAPTAGPERGALRTNVSP